MNDNSPTDRIEELEILTREIETSHAWQIAMRELEGRCDELNDLWHECPQEGLFKMQVTKLAILEILGIVDEWRDELAELKKQVQEEGFVQTGDFDND